MTRRLRSLVTVSGLLALSAAPAFADECAAARAMHDGQKDVELRKENIQRPEWLLMEFLVSDGTEASRKRFETEVRNSAERTQNMAKLLEDMKNLPEDTPDIPDAGTPACDVMTKVKTAVDQLLAQRETEIRKYLDGDYKFIRGCDQMGTQLVALGDSLNKPDSRAKPKLVALAAGTMLGPQMAAAKMKPADFDSLVDDMLAPSTLPGRTRYAYAALRCLRNYQGSKMASLPAATPALAKCETGTWEGLGRCVTRATLLP